ncbi:MAG: thioesterase family protein [Candidatus Aminicenantes bacterium]|nr:thioesterase family protein [Candidatus Aminicenantes bacterium]
MPQDVSARQSVFVEKALSAREIGSGNVDVLATPMMIALMEAAALEAVQSYLPEGWTTVGTKVEVDHTRATMLGDDVTAEATLIKREGRKLDFIVVALDSRGLIGQGHHQRFIVNVEEFMSKVIE